MIHLTIIDDDPLLPGEINVWVALADGDPRYQHESFIIGTGPTRAAAIADAQQELSNLAVRLDAVRQAT